MQPTYDILIMAGYNPDKIDPIKEMTGAHHKVLADVGGKPMVWHVVRAFVESGLAGEIVIVGLGEEYALDFGVPVHYVENQASLWKNLKAGFDAMIQWGDPDRQIIAMSADSPLLTGEIVRWFVEACQPETSDLYWGVVRKEVMEQTFPTSKRTYLPLLEGRFCSGDLFLGRLSTGMRIHAKMHDFIVYRKNPLRQMQLLGFGTLIRLLFRRLSLQGLLGVIERYMDITGTPVIVPFAELGMDVDKAFQYEMVLDYWAKNRGPGANG